MLAAGVVVGLVLMLAGWWVVHLGLRPIRDVTEVADAITRGDRDRRVAVETSGTEAAHLARAFNVMLDEHAASEDQLRQFVADASHELRTPLAAIQTILSSTLARQRAPAEYEQVLADLGQETERLRTLVEGLLHLAHSDAARPVAMDIVNLSNLLVDVTDSLRPLAEEKGLALTADISDNLSVSGDGDDLIRLFVNLLDNAIKYTQHGQINVAAGPQPNGCVQVSIADTGIGIDAAHLPHIFDRFYQVDQARATSGAGLGLAIALSIAQAHGGTIGVESKIGQGTVVTVQLAKEPS
jgi:signal transduction histidine kinase